MDAGHLNPDRFFDPEPETRRAARLLYEETRALPIVSPHGHVDPSLLARNDPFPEPTALIIQPDHYVLRLLYAHGVSLESLGVPRKDGGAVESDPRAVWRLFASRYYLFQGTPSAAWLEYELSEVFGVHETLLAATADRVYDQIAEKLRSPEFRPRALFERFNIEVLATTDGAADTLEHHAAIGASGWKGRVIPTFRPDALLRIASPESWRAEFDAFERVHGSQITTFAGFLDAIRERRERFRAAGAVATDHGVIEPLAERASDAAFLFGRALAGTATPDDERRFHAHMLMKMADMSVQDGLVMQLHAGALRDHNQTVFETFGRDRGGDIPVATEFTRNLHELLNAYGNDSRFTLVAFTLDESTYSRELAPLAGHYPALRLGAPWWFHDSIAGMTRFRERTTETAGIYKTAGFTDDTRAFCSIPARHDLSRRMDANYLGGLVARHIIGMDDARVMAHALAYDLAKQTYHL
ncbi:MAG TPA: glucuronate isomerase [Gemmatimonadaceae bacterium]|nr:glucuronate isomerase [Gemmatimonadaceae bacterium]